MIDAASDAMTFYASPYFWALVAMVGLYGATIMVSGHRIGRNTWFVAAVLTLVTVGRIVLVLPLCPQPRFEWEPWQTIAGGLVLATALCVAVPALSVKWWRAPASDMRLHTSGVYAIVRHPIYLCEVLWPVGWSLMWGSWIGLALTPLWWAAFLLHALAEEERLEAVLGDVYRDYKSRVRGRIVPGLPV